MDGFKNSTKTKYMCGGPVRKAMGGAIKSVAPKSVAKSAASAKQLPTPEIASKPRVQPTPPKNVTKPDNWFIPGKNGSSGGLSLKFMDDMQKRPVKPTPPEPIREAPRPTMEPKRQVQPTPPKDATTPVRDMVSILNAQTKGGAPTPGPQRTQFDTKAIAKYGKATSAKDGEKFGAALDKARQEKTINSIEGMAKKGLAVASNKPMIGTYKTGGYVSKSSFKW